MHHLCIKEHKPRICCKCKNPVSGMVELKENIYLGISRNIEVASKDIQLTRHSVSKLHEGQQHNLQSKPQKNKK